MKYKISHLSSILMIILSVTSQADSKLQALTSTITASASTVDFCVGRSCLGNVLYVNFSANGAHSFYINSADKDKLECEASADRWVYITDYANKKTIKSAVLSAQMAKSKIRLKFRDDSDVCKIESILMYPRDF